MRRAMLIFSLLSITVITGLFAQQDSVRSMLTCHHWLVSRSDQSQHGTGDSIYYLTHYSNREDIPKQYKYHWGFILEKNGTFIELFYSMCGNGRKQGSGFWNLQSDTLRLNFNRNRTDEMQFKIIRLTYKNLELMLLRH